MRGRARGRPSRRPHGCRLGTGQSRLHQGAGWSRKPAGRRRRQHRRPAANGARLALASGRATQRPAAPLMEQGCTGGIPPPSCLQRAAGLERPDGRSRTMTPHAISPPDRAGLMDGLHALLPPASRLFASIERVARAGQFASQRLHLNDFVWRKRLITAWRVGGVAFVAMHDQHLPRLADPPDGDQAHPPASRPWFSTAVATGWSLGAKGRAGTAHLCPDVAIGRLQHLAYRRSTFFAVAVAPVTCRAAEQDSLFAQDLG